MNYLHNIWTVIMGSGLGGDAKSTVIVCASSDDKDAVETIQV